MDISPIAVSAVFLLGLMVGSFLNVCIWRLPQGEQVLAGRSHCRSCRKVIPWRDNIPLLSFALLRGRCRFCQAGISWHYPFVELATGLWFAGVWVGFGRTPLAFVYWFLGSALILVSMIDLREMVLPDEVTLPGILLGVIFSLCFPQLHAASSRWAGLGSSVAGALAGAGTLWGIGVVGKWVFKRDAMGQGDVKLMAMVGSFLGAAKVLLVNLVVAPMLGSMVGLVLKYRYGRDLIPFGPFLSLGTLAAVFWGDGLIRWYGRLFF